MTRTSVPTLLVTLLVVATAAPAGAGAAAADGDFVSVSVDAPAFPSPEQPFRIATAVTNAESSGVAYDVNRLELREGEPSGSKLRASREPGPTTVEPGETVRRGFEATLNETGQRDLYVHVVLESRDGERRRVVHPLTLRVDGEHPQLSLDTEAAVSTDARAMTVTVSNGRDEAIRQLAVEVDGERVSIEEDARIRARLDGGAEADFEFTGGVETVGEYPVEVSLSYTTADGENRRLTRLFRADFTPPSQPTDHPQLAVETESAVEGAWRSLNVTVSNGMETAVRQVSLKADGDAVTIRENRRVVPSLAAGTERTFSYRARTADSGAYPVNLTLIYTDGDGVERRIARTATADLTSPDNPGNVSLTGVSAEWDGDRLTVSGSAANLGGEAVESVVVSVADRENVRKAQPQPEYFVGTVESSDFVTFDVNAALSNNRTTVPLRVSYVVDDVTRTRTVAVDAGPAPTAGEQSRSGGGSIPLVPVGGLVALLIVAGVWWTRR